MSADIWIISYRDSYVYFIEVSNYNLRFHIRYVTSSPSVFEPGKMLSPYEKELVECFRRAAKITENPYLDPALAGSDAFIFRTPPAAQPTTRNFEGLVLRLF